MIVETLCRQCQEMRRMKIPGFFVLPAPGEWMCRRCRDKRGRSLKAAERAARAPVSQELDCLWCGQHVAREVPTPAGQPDPFVYCSKSCTQKAASANGVCRKNQEGPKETVTVVCRYCATATSYLLPAGSVKEPFCPTGCRKKFEKLERQLQKNLLATRGGQLCPHPNKKMFADIIAGWDYLDRMNNTSMRAYWCRCGGVHIGHPTIPGTVVVNPRSCRTR